MLLRAPTAVAVWDVWHVRLHPPPANACEPNLPESIDLTSFGFGVALTGVMLIVVAVAIELMSLVAHPLPLAFPSDIPMRKMGPALSSDTDESATSSSDADDDGHVEAPTALPWSVEGSDRSLDSLLEDSSTDDNAGDESNFYMPAPWRPTLRSDQPLRRRASSVYDNALSLAFHEADKDCSGDLSKRQLYAALRSLGFEMTSSEALFMWRLFDRNANGRVDHDEFRSLGAALLEQAQANIDDRHRSEGGGRRPQQRGGFALRRLSQEQRVLQTTTRIRSLARRRSLERIRVAVASASELLGSEQELSV